VYVASSWGFSPRCAFRKLLRFFTIKSDSSTCSFFVAMSFTSMASAIGSLFTLAAGGESREILASDDLTGEMPEETKQGIMFAVAGKSWLRESMTRKRLPTRSGGSCIVNLFGLFSMAVLCEADRVWDKVTVENDHERRAALVCLLTAAFVAQGTAKKVGEAEGGWFWLTPMDLWQECAKEGLSRAEEELG